MEKAPYEKKAADAKDLYEKQKTQLAAKGYYMLKDGSKSTDDKNADLLKVKKAKKKFTSDDEVIGEKPKKAKAPRK